MIASRSEGQSPSTASTKRFRSACDYCHDTKVKCSGTKPCEKCEKIGFDCTYSVSNRMGRPKDTRNKKTLERVRQSQEAKAAREAREAEGARSLDAERTSMQTMPVVGPCRVDLTAEEALSLDGASLDIGLGVVNHAMSREATTLTSSSNDTRMSGLDMLSDTDSFSPLHISNDPKAPGGMDDFWNLDMAPGVSMPSLTPDVLSTDVSCCSSDIATPFHFPTGFGPEPAIDPSNLMLEGFDALSESQIRDPKASVADFFSTTKGQVAFGQPTMDNEKCSCPETQTNLMLRLRRCGKSGQPTLDRGAALSLVSHSVASWQDLTRCSYCSTCVRAKEEYVLEVVMLATMNLRLLLSIIHTLVKNLASIGKDLETIEHADQYRTLGKRAKSATEITTPRSYIGAYEMNHEEDKLVASLLLFRALNSMHAILSRLRQQLHEMESCLQNGQHNDPSNDDLFSPFDSSSSSTSSTSRRKCSCVGEVSKKRGHSPDLSHAAEEKLHEIWHVRCTLQRLEEAVRPLKSQTKAYLSHHT